MELERSLVGGIGYSSTYMNARCAVEERSIGRGCMIDLNPRAMPMGVWEGTGLLLLMIGVMLYDEEGP